MLNAASFSRVEANTTLWADHLLEVKYGTTMFTMTTAANKSLGIFSAIVSGVVTLLLSFWVFRWGFIQLWESQHGGRQMVFVFDPEIKAAVMAIVFGVAVFVVLLWRSARNSKAYVSGIEQGP